MRMPLLPRWVLTNPLPAFYDIESTTSVQMTAKLYKYIQGFTDDYNKFAEDVNVAITDFINDVNADQECFENNINKIVHDYIITIDSKIAHQDREIEEAIFYIKENLETSIINVINQMRESGELGEIITESLEGLTSRLSTLETSVTELSTSLEGVITRVTTNESDIDTLEGKVTALEGKVTTNESDITALEEKVTTNESDITSLEGKMEDLFDYSTETEKVVGKWIDGKPLYRRLIKTEAPEVTTDGTIASKYYTVTNAEAIIIEWAYAYFENIKTAYPLPFLNSGLTQQLKVTAENGLIVTHGNVLAWNNNPVYVLILYTKSTD